MRQFYSQGLCQRSWILTGVTKRPDWWVCNKSTGHTWRTDYEDDRGQDLIRETTICWYLSALKSSSLTSRRNHSWCSVSVKARIKVQKVLIWLHIWPRKLILWEHDANKRATWTPHTHRQLIGLDESDSEVLRWAGTDRQRMDGRLSNSETDSKGEN